VRRVTSPEILRSLGRHGDDCRACSHDPRLEPSQDRAAAIEGRASRPEIAKLKRRAQLVVKQAGQQ